MPIKIQIKYIQSPQSTQPVISFWKGIILATYDFHFRNPYLLLRAFLSFTCLEQPSRISCSITFPEIEVRLISLWFHRSSFQPFLKTRVIPAFFQSSGKSYKPP